MARNSQRREPLFLGESYCLRVIEPHGAGKVILRNKSFMNLYAQPATSAEQREQVLQRCYRQQLKALTPSPLEKWQAVLSVQVADWGIKKMKTMWGACTNKARRIWINLELAKEPVQCLQYIIVHCYIFWSANDQLRKLMDQWWIMPSGPSPEERLG
jgi:predicted metal-dependent hydrolase